MRSSFPALVLLALLVAVAPLAQADPVQPDLLQPTARDFDASLARALSTAGPDTLEVGFQRRGFEFAEVSAEAPKSADPAGEGGGVDLAKQAQNPISNLISLPFQNNTGFQMGPHGRSNNILNIQPVIPVQLGKWILINRTIRPVVYQPDQTQASGGWTGIGDLNTTVFLVPPLKGKFMVGFGPILTFPTASSKPLGTDTWGAGPSAAVVTMPGKFVLGCLVNNVWSYAGDGNDVNTMLVQPFVNYNLPNKWYLVTAPIITANWKAPSDNRWLVPVGGGFGKIFKVGRQPLNASLQAYYDIERPEGAPRWQLRFQVQLLFPTK